MFEPKLQGCIKFMKDHAKTIERQGYPPIIEGVLPYYNKTIEYLEGIKSGKYKELKSGEWKTVYLDHESFGIRPKGIYCSECQQIATYKPNFCPNCGADMRKEGDGT